MKWKGTTLLMIVVLVALLPFTVLADKPIKTDSQGMEIAWEATSNAGCTKIQDGTLLAQMVSVIDGGLRRVGLQLPGTPLQWPLLRCLSRCGLVSALHRRCELMMKWNDAWLANMDCDGDGAARPSLWLRQLHRLRRLADEPPVGRVRRRRTGRSASGTTLSRSSLRLRMQLSDRWLLVHCRWHGNRRSHLGSLRHHPGGRERSLRGRSRPPVFSPDHAGLGGW